MADAFKRNMKPSEIPFEELALAFAGRPHLAELWEKLSRGATDLADHEKIEYVLAEARIFDYRGDYAKSLALGEQAMRMARDRQDSDGQSSALVTLALTYYRLGDYEKSTQLAREAMANGDVSPTGSSAWSVLGLVASFTEDWKFAEECYQRSIKIAQRIDYPYGYFSAQNNAAILYQYQGRFELAISADLDALQLATEIGYGRWAPLVTVAALYLIRGERARAREMIELLNPLVASSGLTKGFQVLLIAWLAMDEEDHDLARSSLVQIGSVVEPHGNAVHSQYYRMLSCRLARLQNDSSTALSWADEAIAFSQRRGHRFHECDARIERARVCWLLDDLPAVERELLAVLDIAEKLGAQYQATLSTFLLAALRHQQKHLDADATWLDAARRIKIGGYGFIFERERALAFTLVAHYLRSRDPAVRASAETALEQLAKITPLPLHVYGLGRYEVWQGRRKIPDREWQKRRAGELFRFLLLQPRHVTTRDVIFEALCPDQSTESAQNFLNHATSTLRRILEPDLPDKFPSRYLSVEGEQVELQLPSGSSIDWEEFERSLSTKMHEVTPIIEETLAPYRGELFPLDRYADWSTEARERLAETHRRALLELAQKDLVEGNAKAALDACRQVIASDPWREDAYLIGMKACLALNDRPGALHLYRDLERHLQSDLQISPRQDLQDLASEIKSK